MKVYIVYRDYTLNSGAPILFIFANEQDAIECCDNLSWKYENEDVSFYYEEQEVLL